MKLVSFDDGQSARLGVLPGSDRVVDVARAAPGSPSTLLELLRAGPRAMAAVRDAVRSPADAAVLDLAAVRIQLPIAVPGKIICLGLNYADHAKEGGHARPDYPSLFLRAATSLVAHGEPIVRPACSEQLDYEAELAAIVGTRVRNVPVADALDCVAGYACFNDGTVRDYQRKTAQWTIGKNFDATGAFGPVFVTADELPPGAAGILHHVPPERARDAGCQHLGHAVSRRRNRVPAERVHDARAR
jgi:2-keto-4-pentenoate hydratase/2-oxohepta-3-ene-1,7-dioic acid hydratase in catechol pathway